MSVPPLVSAPEMFATSLVSGDLLISKMLVQPAASVSELLKVSVPSGLEPGWKPMELPGASVPPLWMVVEPLIAPVPPSAAAGLELGWKPPSPTVTAPPPASAPNGDRAAAGQRAVDQ